MTFFIWFGFKLKMATEPPDNYFRAIVKGFVSLAYTSSIQQRYNSGT
jgi:hypothetical protein